MTAASQPATGGPAPLDLDRLIHEPARLVLVSNLYIVEEADFVFLTRQTGLTDGNISSHMARLESGGYITIDKRIVGKRPRTTYALTEAGRKAFEHYRQQVTGLFAVSDP